MVNFYSPYEIQRQGSVILSQVSEDLFVQLRNAEPREIHLEISLI